MTSVLIIDDMFYGPRVDGGLAVDSALLCLIAFWHGVCLHENFLAVIPTDLPRNL